MGNSISSDILIIGNYNCLGRHPIESYFGAKEADISFDYTEDYIKIYDIYYDGVHMRVISSPSIPNFKRLKQLNITDLSVILMYDSNKSYISQASNHVNMLFQYNTLTSKFFKKVLNIRICIGDINKSHVKKEDKDIIDLGTFYPINVDFVFKEVEIDLYFSAAMDSLLLG